jgi:predicted AAA+ superfamily ATPase
MIAALPDDTWVIVDEIQKVPALLDEVHRIMGARRLRFALSGSSARKLKRGGANLLAGRAVTRHMEGLTASELGDAFDLSQAIEWGTLPLVALAPDRAVDVLETYVNTYIREEIREEGVVRKIEPFLRFLEVAGLLNGQKVVLQNVAREAQVPASNVANYFSILADTLVGHWLNPYRPAAKVREVAASKFYWFDPGVARAANGMLRDPLDGSARGFALETLLFHELRVYDHTRGKGRFIGFYETGAGSEIDFIVEVRKRTQSKPPQVVAIEVKAARRWDRKWERAIRDLEASGKVDVVAMLGVYQGNERLTFDRFTVLPVNEFLRDLADGRIY